MARNTQNEKKSYTIALAGNPNSGKTTLFNAMTGSNQKVGNWPGVTVDKKEGALLGHEEIKIEDLPGIYSLSPYSLEEVVSRKYLVDERPDLIINVVDGSNLVRNLYLTSQLLELGIPTIIALNMMDVVKKRGDRIDQEKLSEIFSTPIVEVIASREDGLDQLVEEVLAFRGREVKPKPLKFSKDLEGTISKLEGVLDLPEKRLSRYYAIKVFERDSLALLRLDLPEEKKRACEELTKDLEERLDDRSEGIMASARYDGLEEVAQRTLVRAELGETRTEKIDRIVTGKYTGFPIFALIMFFVYYLSVSTLGAYFSGLVEDFFSGPVANGLEGFLRRQEVAEPVVELVSKGIIPGVGTVLQFLPQMLILFFFLSILEDVGYMSRVAFVMDRVFRRFGLSGKSFIPLMVGTGCSVPGIQSSRTIENERDRRITIMTTSFMPCSAKLPIISLIGGSFFPDHQGLISFSIYMLGIASVLMSGVILKKFKTLVGKPAAFVMELPDYRKPRLKFVLMDVWEKGLSFLKRATTVILLSSVAIRVLGNFDYRFNFVGEEAGNSILAGLGSLFAPIFIPNGFGNWKAAVATFTGFAAKENIVSTLGVLMGLGQDVASGSQGLAQGFAQIIQSPIAAYSFLAFNMLCMPCVSAVGAIKAEMNSKSRTRATIGYQMGFAYAISLIIYQAGLFYQTRTFTGFTLFALVVLLGLLYLIFRRPSYQED